MTGPASGREEVVLEPSRGLVPLDLRALWQHRELVYFLALRDVKLRYKQTVLGVLWAVLQPLLSMVVFTVFFGRLAGIPSDGVPYPLFAYAGLLPWTFFAAGMSQAGNSLVGNQALLTKVWFPRLVIPLSATLSGLIDLLVAAVLLVVLLAYYGRAPGWQVVWVVPLVLVALATSLGVGLWLSALNVLYRDVRHLLPFLTQLWFFVTPVVYPASLVPEQWRGLYALNPMVGVVEGFRWALLGTPWSSQLVAPTLGTLLVLCVGGALFFRRMERTFADLA